MPRTVIFDFDGTIALGDGPVDAYARGVIALADAPGLDAAISRSRERLAADPRSFRDGYDAVASAARDAGVDEPTLSAAYRRSRDLLATADAPVNGAPGLAEFLGRLGARAALVLVTNAPPTQVPEALSQLGVANAFTRRVCSAGKPEGLAAQVAAALERGPVLSVGDIDEFDLAPARALGADTALVGATAAHEGHRATFAASRLEDLYADIEMWVSAPAPIPHAPAGT
ncbi:HAD family hydrolase [Demequina sp. SO4-18]|uniref:HAD family hydrolase n=1 Tax=Demequina sp. SO4-18 TaxID=3401026 RepID=UPI003B5C7B51